MRRTGRQNEVAVEETGDDEDGDGDGAGTEEENKLG